MYLLLRNYVIPSVVVPEQCAVLTIPLTPSADAESALLGVYGIIVNLGAG